MTRLNLRTSLWLLSLIPAVTYAQDLALDVITLTVPSGFTVVQEAEDAGTKFVLLQKNDDVIAIYAQKGEVDVVKVIASASTVTANTSEEHGPFRWKMFDAKYSNKGRRAYVKGFSTQHGNTTFYGYSRASSTDAAGQNVLPVLDSMRLQMMWPGSGRSLTSADYSGKKYYFGWGVVGQGDPSMMHNEVKYDVLHTHDIFTKSYGGNYIAEKYIGSNTSASRIRNEWASLKSQISSNDMYVQYSSGHGMQSGLGVGVSYKEMRDAALGLSAKEVIILTMACYSGNLIESFNAKKDVWSNWQNQGRSLFVLASSLKSETSSTGPGTDGDESGGPNGSAGSAFGHALWKSLIGYADGYVDGVKDGFLSLEEIREYTIAVTKEVGGHTPVSTGSYYGSLVMNRVPPKAILERFERGTEGLSDEEIQAQIQELDAAMSRPIQVH